jgi:hypothetical protein
MHIKGNRSDGYYKQWKDPNAQHKSTISGNNKIAPGQDYDINAIVDEWFKWYLSIPTTENPIANLGTYFQYANTYLFNKNNTLVYFVAVAPFQKPDFRRIIMTRKAALLVPVYKFHASRQDYPSLQNEDALIKLVKDDLDSVLLEATFDDDQSIHGTLVMKEKPLEVSNVPKNNLYAVPEDRLEAGSTTKIYHGGYWILIKDDMLTPGDHLLWFKAESKNFEVEAKIFINALF